MSANTQRFRDLTLILLGEFLKSAVAKHACLLDHAIDWESANVLDYTGDFLQRKIPEALRIRRHTGVLMNKNRRWKISETWSASWRPKFSPE